MVWRNVFRRRSNKLWPKEHCLIVADFMLMLSPEFVSFERNNKFFRMILLQKQVVRVDDGQPEKPVKLYPVKRNTPNADHWRSEKKTNSIYAI